MPWRKPWIGLMRLHLRVGTHSKFSTKARQARKAQKKKFSLHRRTKMRVALEGFVHAFHSLLTDDDYLSA